MSLPGLPIEFRCPVCSGCVWRDNIRRVHLPVPHERDEYEAVYVTVGQVCATCEPDRPRRRLETVRDADPDAGNINHGY